MYKGINPISKKVRFTCERIMLSFVLFFLFSLFHVLFFVSCFSFLFFCVFYYKNTMNVHRHKILVVLVFTMVIY